MKKVIIILATIFSFNSISANAQYANKANSENELIQNEDFRKALSKKNRGVTEMFIGTGCIVGGCTLIACFPTTIEKRTSEYIESRSSINAGFICGSILCLTGVVTEICGVTHYIFGKEKMRDIALVLSPNSVRFVF